MSKNAFITQFNRVMSATQKADCVEFKEPSKVKQSLSYATDINTIYENYCRTGKVPLNGNQPIYDENFIKYDNLIEAQKQVAEASAYFQNLPASIRAKYGNSLEKFVIGLHSQDEFLVKEGVLKLSESNVSDNNTTVVGPTTGSTTVIDTPVQPSVQAPATGEVATA
jgi:hypothetical protein